MSEFVEPKNSEVVPGVLHESSITVPDTVAGFGWYAKMFLRRSADIIPTSFLSSEEEPTDKGGVLKETIFKVLMPQNTIGVTKGVSLTVQNVPRHLPINRNPEHALYIKKRNRDIVTQQPFIEPKWQNRFLTRVLGSILIGGGLVTGGAAAVNAIELHRMEATVEGTRMPGMVDEVRAKAIVDGRNALLNLDVLRENKEWYAVPQEFVRSPITSNAFLTLLLASCGASLITAAGHRENEYTRSFDMLQSMLKPVNESDMEEYYKGAKTS